jgi:phasin family protein
MAVNESERERSCEDSDCGLAERRDSDLQERRNEVVRGGTGVVFKPRRYAMAKTGRTSNRASSPFPDIAKLVERLKLPGLDVSKIAEAQRKNIEALTQANQAAFEGMQDLAKRQMEILQKAATEWQAAMTEATNRESTSAAQRAELAEKTFSNAFATMRELAETASKAQAQAWEVIQKRFQDSLAELRDVLQPPK